MQLILPTTANIIECVYNSEYNSCLQVIKAREAKHFDKHFSLLFCFKCNGSVLSLILYKRSHMNTCLIFNYISIIIQHYIEYLIS